MIAIQTIIDNGPCEGGLDRAIASLPDGDHDYTRLCKLSGFTECTTQDLLWALPHSTLSDEQVKRIAVRLSVFCARQGLHLFESGHPGDNRPRKAAEAAERWLEEPTEENRFTAGAAAIAAESAAAAGSAAESAAAESAAAESAAAAAESAAAQSAATRFTAWSAGSAARFARTAAGRTGRPASASAVREHLIELLEEAGS